MRWFGRPFGGQGPIRRCVIWSADPDDRKGLGAGTFPNTGSAVQGAAPGAAPAGGRTAASTSAPARPVAGAFPLVFLIALLGAASPAVAQGDGAPAANGAPAADVNPDGQVDGEGEDR